MGWSEVQTLTAVFSPPRPPADRRLSEVRRGDQRYSMPRYPSRAAWEERKAHLRRQILTAAGLWPEPERTPLQPIRTGRVERDGYSVENVALQSRPGFYVTGNLYLPLNVGGPYPAILNPHGHSRKGRLEHSEIFSTPLRCISLARQGYAAFAYDMVGYNDARQIRHDFGSWPDWLWSLGALGLQLWNSRRALDFLLSLPEVDPARLGCTGESGGGTQTFLLAAVDERVTHVAPNVMVSAHFQGGCVCENIPNLRLDTFNVEIAAMAAPRPMILVSATGDWTRNTPTVEYPAIREVYALYGAEERLSEQQIEAPHNYNQESREAVYRFFGHWFKGLPSDTATREEPLTPPEEATLRVFLDQLPSGALDEDGLRRSVVALTKQQLTDAWPDGRANLAAFRERFDVSYRYSLDTEPPGPDGVDVKRLGEGRFGDWSAQRLAFGRLREGTPAGDSIPALFFGAQEGRPLLVVHGAGKAALFGGSDGEAVPGRLLTALLRRQRPLLVIDAWLTGDYITPGAQPGRDVAAPYFTTFNRADAALRVQDVCTAVAALRQLTGAAEVDLLGLEEGGLGCLLARPLAQGVARLVADGAGFDWQDDAAYLARLYIPGLRRAGGLATALALAAPAPVRLFRLTAPEVSEQVTALYAALGAQGDLTMQEEPAGDDQLLAWLG